MYIVLFKYTTWSKEVSINSHKLLEIYTALWVNMALHMNQVERKHVSNEIQSILSQHAREV